jgi:hypothetical protein
MESSGQRRVSRAFPRVGQREKYYFLDSNNAFLASFKNILIKLYCLLRRVQDSPERADCPLFPPVSVERRKRRMPQILRGGWTGYRSVDGYS